MDYEKLHKDTIAKLQEMVNSGKITVEIARGICADFIPESEDEKIRKEIVNFINHKKAMGSVTPEESKRTGSWVAWLEKHGERPNNVYDEYLSDNLGCVIRRYINDPSIPDAVREMVKREIIPYVERLEKQGEQKPVVIIPKFRVGDVIRLKGSTAEYTIESISGECYHGKGWGLHIGYEEDYELVEQNPSWSEEDEQMYIEIIYILAGFRGNEVKLDWLKSIKDRIQPKQEWSENEKDRLNKISKYLRCKGYEDDACWLKSLIPQHTWKPSDEQINALEGIKDYVALTSGYWGQTMTEIIKQLKQL